MPEMTNKSTVEYNFNTDIEQILDPKLDNIQSNDVLPSPTDGRDGEIRVGIKHKNKVLMGTKVGSDWYFSEMKTISNLLSDKPVETKVNTTKNKKTLNKAKFATEIVSLTTDSSAGVWKLSSALSHISANNIISLSGVLVHTNIAYDLGYVMTGVTDDPAIGSIIFTESTKKIGVMVHDSAYTSKPCKITILYTT